MNKIPLSVVALAAVTVSATAADNQAAIEEALKALDAKREAATIEIARVINVIDTYHGAVKEEYHAKISQQQALLNIAFDEAKKKVAAGEEGVVLDTEIYVGEVKRLGDEAKKKEAEYVAWDDMYEGVFQTLISKNDAVNKVLANLTYSKDTQTDTYNKLDVKTLINAVEADNTEGGNIKKTEEYTAKIEELTAALEKILKEWEGIEGAAEKAAKNTAAYEEVKKAIKAATDKRNEVRDALVTLLPSPVYADWQSAALTELTEQVTKVINEVEKSNEAHKETATTVKNDNLQKLSAVTGGGDVDPSFSMCVADQILANYTGMKEDQEDAYTALNAEFKGKFDLFAPVKKTIEESTVEYLNADSTALSKAYQDVKASIDAAYKGHTADQKTVKYDDIDVLLAALSAAADKAKADFYAHKESKALIKAKQKALDAAIENAKKKTEVGNYEAYEHFTKTSDDLRNKIKAEVTLEAAAWSTTDKTTAGKAAVYRTQVETNLNKINITAYTTNTDDAKAYYTTAWNTIDADDKALNSKEEGALGLKETAKGDLTVTVDGNVGSSTYDDAIKHFEDQIGKLKKALTDAFAKTDTEHLKLLETASKNEVADFVGTDKAGQDLEAKTMKDLTDKYLTNKTTFEANLKIEAAGKILGEVEGQLKSAETELAQVINLDKDAPVADYEPKYGFKAQEIKDLRDTVNDHFGKLSKTYTNSKEAWDGYDRDAKIKNAPDVIASLNALKNDLNTLQASVTDLKAQAESAAKNKTAYDNVDKAIVAATNAISTAQTNISEYNKIVITDEGGRKHFNEILSSLTESKNTLANELKSAYETVKDTKQTVVENEADFTNRAQQIKAEAGDAYNDFVQNEIAHKNHVDARDTELKEVQKLYDEISSEDETTAAHEYLATLAQLQEQLNNMTSPAAKGIITEKLAAGLSKQDNDEVLDAIKAITKQRIDIRDTQADEYVQNVLDDNDAELGVVDAAYLKAYGAFQDAVKTLNDYAAITYDEAVKDIAQAKLIETHDKIYAQAAPLLEQKNTAHTDHSDKSNREKPEFFKSADYVKAIVAIENQINSDINAYVTAVNKEAAKLVKTALDVATTALNTAKNDATYKAFEYATRDKAFKDVEDLIKLVKDNLGEDAETVGTADPKFAVNLDKQGWLNGLKTVGAKIADAQLAAAKAEYDYQLAETNKLVEAEKDAIKKLGNIDKDEWLATFETNELKNTVNAAIKKANKDGVKYKNIDAIKALLAAFGSKMYDDGNGKLHTATYYDAKTANDAAGENNEAVKILDEKIPAAVKVVDELGDWLDDLFVAHTSPAGAAINLYTTLAEQIDGIAKGYDDQVKDGGAVGYLKRWQGILDDAANQAKDIKKRALREELNAVQGLIENAEEKYNQYANTDLEGASKFDGRISTAKTTLTGINELYGKIVDEKTYDDVKSQVLDLESTIAVLDGELAKKMDSNVITNAHNALTASIQTVKDNIDDAQTQAQKYDAINAVFGKALGELSADLTNLSDKEAQLYKDAALLMYVDNLNNDLNDISSALSDLKASTATEEGLDNMYTRFEKNETYYIALKTKLAGYQTELDRVKEAVADYKSISADWKADYVDEIEDMIAKETKALNAIYTGISAEVRTSGVNKDTKIARAQEIQEKTAKFELDAAGQEYFSLYNAAEGTVDDANTQYNAIVSGNVDGKRYNPATQKELASTLTELQNSVSHVADYAETLTEFGNNENNPYGYVEVDLNGAPIALDPVTDLPMSVKRYFLEAWYNEIHAALNTLIGGANEVAGDVENRAFVLGDVNNNGVINVADYDAVRRMILSADMKKFDDAVRIFGEVQAYAADVNEDKAIDVADLTSISNFIFNGGFDKDAVSKAARVKTAGKVMCDDVVTLQAVSEETTLTGKTMRLAVNVANTTDYVNFQMDVQLPEGMTLVGESLSERANGHLLSTADLGNGAFRMVAENVENVAFGNQTNAVLYLDVEVSSSYNAGEVALSNIIFSDAKGNAYRMNGLTTNAPTGINEITAPNMKERIYSVGGQVMKAMKKGVNIIKGEGSVKKVVKK